VEFGVRPRGMIGENRNDVVLNYHSDHLYHDNNDAVRTSRSIGLEQNTAFSKRKTKKKATKGHSVLSKYQKKCQLWMLCKTVATNRISTYR